MTKVCVIDGKDIEYHKLQHFSNSLKGRGASYFARYETPHLIATWNEVQWTFIMRFGEICNKWQVAVTLKYAKHKRCELVENYFDQLMWLCAVIPQWPNGIYLREVFREGLRTRVKMVIINMPHKTIMEVTKSIILIEEKMPIRRNNMARYQQNFDNEDSKGF